MLRFRFALMFAGMIASQAVHAEPYTPPTIYASYTTTLIMAPGQDKLYTGAEKYYDETTDTMVDVYSYAYLPSAIDGLIDSSGNQIRFAGQSKESYFFTDSPPVPGSPNDTNQFRVQFTITDLASGETGVLGFDAVAVLSSALPAELRGESGLYAAYSSSASAIHLGANRYEFLFDGGHSDSGAWLFATVSVTAATPEPATLVMAGVGLLSAFGVRRRIKRVL
jgi:hypothetical protein